MRASPKQWTSLNQQNLIPVYLKHTFNLGFNLRRVKEMKASSDVNISTGFRKKKIHFGLGTETALLVQLIVALPSGGKSWTLPPLLKISSCIFLYTYIKYLLIAI